MPSFDVVSEIDRHELDNALNQARKEIAQRFDFKGSKTELDEVGDQIVITSSSEGRVEAAWDVVASKLIRRGLSLQAFRRDEIEPTGGMRYRQKISLNEGIDQDLARKMVKSLKGSGLKVQTAVQGPSLRITGKKRDDLQAAIQHLKEAEFEAALQFNNFRD